MYIGESEGRCGIETTPGRSHPPASLLTKPDVCCCLDRAAGRGNDGRARNGHAVRCQPRLGVDCNAFLRPHRRFLGLD